MKLALLTIAFFITAFLYASVGFGGGSTYTALLAISGISITLVPVISLACNILVVSGNTLRYTRQKMYNFSKIWPLIILSIPAAWFGGSLPISEKLFIGLLAIALFIASLRLLSMRANVEPEGVREQSTILNAVIGGGIGFYSGLVGIGGGIFLAPVLYVLKWGSAREIAAASSLFILVNSISGLSGQLTKFSDLSSFSEVLSYWPLLLAVFIGGQIGNYLGVFRISEKWLRRLTGALILLVALRLFWRWWGL